MSIRTIVPILFVLSLLQGCMPDSFTKFKEDPVKKAAEVDGPDGSGGSGGDGDDDGDPTTPPPRCSTDLERVNDGFCVEPEYVVIDNTDPRLVFAGQGRVNKIDLLINNSSSLDSTVLRFFLGDEDEIPIYSNPLSTSNALFLDSINEFTTYSVSTSPATVGLPDGMAADIDTGEIFGIVTDFYPETTIRVSASYSGNSPTQLTLLNSLNAELTLAAYNDIDEELETFLPEGHGIVLELSNLNDIEVGDTLFFPRGGNIVVNAIDPSQMLVFATINNTRPSVEVGEGVFKTSTFSNQTATVLGYYASLMQGSSLSRDTNQNTTFYTRPLAYNGEIISKAENDLYTYSSDVDLSVVGLSLMTTGRCGTDECLYGGATSSYCTNRVQCESNPTRFWVPGGAIIGTPGVDQNGNPLAIPPAWRTGVDVTITATGPTILLPDSTVTTLTADKSITLAINNQIERVAYEHPIGALVRVPVSSTSSFSVGNTVSTNSTYPAVGTIEAITSSPNALEIRVTQNGACFNATNTFTGLYTNRSTCEAQANHRWQPSFFHAGRRLSLGPVHIAPVADITEDATLVFDSTVAMDLHLYMSRSSNFNAANLIPTSERGAFLFSITPNIELAGPTFANGNINGNLTNLTNPVAPTEFVLTATSPSGNQATTTTLFEFTSVTSEGKFILAKDLIIKVPTHSAFRVGDYISTNNSNPGKGYVRELITIGADRYIWLHVLQGGFEVGNNLDNIPSYFQQRSQVLEVAPINAVLHTGNFNSGQISSYLQDDVLDFQVLATQGAGNQATIMLADHTTDQLYVLVEEGSFTIGTNIATDALNLTLTNIDAHLLNFSFTAPVTIGDDQNIVQAPNTQNYTAMGLIRDAGTPALVEVMNGTFTPSTGNTFFENPVLSVGSPATIAANGITTVNNRFVAHTGQPFEIVPFYFGSLPDDFSFTIDPALPTNTSLDFDVDTGVISGTPEDRMGLTQFTVTGSDDRSFTFWLEIKDYFEIRLADAPTSYHLHHYGMGKGRTPCRISRETLESGRAADKDIICMLDAGERELFLSGVDFEIVRGGSMCPIISYSPYTFLQYPAGAQLNNNLRTVVRRTGACFPSASQPEFVQVTNLGNYSTNRASRLNAANFSTTITPNDGDNPLADPSIPVSGFNSACWHDYSGIGGPNCDEGQVRQIEEVWEETPAYCDTVASGGLPADTQEDRCGECSDPGQADEGACNAATETWTSYYVDADCSPGVFVTAADTNVSCGGEINACVSGPKLSEFAQFDGIDHLLGVSVNYPIPPGTPVGTPPTPIERSLPAPESLGLDEVLYLANYHKIAPGAGSCIAATTPFSYHAQTWHNWTRSLALDAASDAASQTDFTIQNPEAGSAFYTIRCQDAGGGTLARVRLLIREWDQGFRVTDDIDRMYPTATNPAHTPTTQLFRAGALGVTDPTFGDVLNMYRTWRDYTPGANYTCNPTGTASPNTPFTFPLGNL